MLEGRGVYCVIRGLPGSTLCRGRTRVGASEGGRMHGLLSGSVGGLVRLRTRSTEGAFAGCIEGGRMHGLLSGSVRGIVRLRGVSREGACTGCIEGGRMLGWLSGSVRGIVRLRGG